MYLVLLGITLAVSVLAQRIELEPSLVLLGPSTITPNAPWGSYQGAVVGNWFVLVGDELGRAPATSFVSRLVHDKFLFIDLAPVSSNQILVYEPTFAPSNQPPTRAPGNWSNFHNVVAIDNKIVVIDLSETPQISIFDFAAGGKWKNYQITDFSGIPPTTPRFGLAAVAVNRSTIILHGGQRNLNSNSTLGLTETYSLDIVQMSWTQLSDGPPRALHSMGVIGNFVVSVGGFQVGMNTVAANESQIVNTVNLFDYKENSWSVIPTEKTVGTPPQALGAATAVTYQNKIIYFGGYPGGATVLGSVRILTRDDVNDVWIWTSGKSGFGRAVHVAGITSNGYMPIFTGHKAPPFAETIPIYSVSADSWANNGVPIVFPAVASPTRNETKQNPQSTTPAGNNDSLSTGAIVGIIIAVIAVLGFIIVFVLYRKYKPLLKPKQTIIVAPPSQTSDSYPSDQNYRVSSIATTLQGFDNNMYMQPVPESQPPPFQTVPPSFGTHTHDMLPMPRVISQDPRPIQPVAGPPEPMPYEVALRLTELQNERIRMELELAKAKMKN